MRIAVVGMSGFVGSAVGKRLQRHGHDVVRVSAPRLHTAARDISTLMDEAAAVHHVDLVNELARQIVGVDSVVNCAGLASPSSRADDTLYGANSLLPLILLRACASAGVERLIHASTAAVLGSEVLRDGWHTHPQTPYGDSKALGEQSLRQGGATNTVSVRILRPTSVHGRGRQVTATLVRLARSPMSSVAGKGDHPSPQVLVERVAEVIEVLTTSEEAPEHPVVQPWDGVTVRSLLEDLGGGSRPKPIPQPLARLIVAIAARVPHPWFRSQARRAEMLWFGQAHEEGWLTSRGLVMTEPDHQAWRELGNDVAREDRM